jgi:glycosyltransferase A (GT-A) superfamily protein (DUF2064 family)
VRLLTLKIQEPLPGHVFPEMAADHGPEEAARRYRAVAVTTLRQLRGLTEARLRIETTPGDAHEAVRFWLLPRLAEKWHSADGVFLADGLEIDFGGGSEEFPIHASGEILCPFLGARWVHAALLGLGRTTHQVIGPAIGGGEYFRAHALETPADLPPRVLPELPIIQTSDHWQQALDSALGPALKRAWEEEG